MKEEPAAEVKFPIFNINGNIYPFQLSAISCCLLLANARKKVNCLKNPFDRLKFNFSAFFPFLMPKCRKQKAYEAERMNWHSFGKRVGFNLTCANVHTDLIISNGNKKQTMAKKSSANLVTNSKVWFNF